MLFLQEKMYLYHAFVEYARFEAKYRESEDLGVNFRCVEIFNSILSNPTSKVIKMYCVFSKLIRLSGE